MRNATHKGSHKGKRSTKGSKINSSSKKSADDLFKVELGVFRRLCLAVNTPFAIKQLAFLDEGNFEAIANAPFPDPESESFPDDYLIQQVLRKNPRLPLGIDKESVAKQGFFESQAACYETNQLLKLCTGDYASPKRASLAIDPQILGGIRKFIAGVLGDVSQHLHDLSERTRFGPGATFHCGSRDLTPGKKISAPIGLTPSLIKFVGTLEPYGWVQCTSGYALTRGSRACFVRKDATTDRFIAIEPSLNMRWQLAIGSLIRHLLQKRLHINLSYQADVNRRYVRRAHIDGKCTIDVRRASDSVARLLPGFLLETGWASLLQLFRSPEIYFSESDHWEYLEIFSSMGNGFTFELETLIFLAISRQFDPDSQVFGDDIIVDQKAASQVIRTLNVFGFSVNEKKTFLAGSFFESCGVDVWRGQDVRPFFLKKDDKAHDFTSNVIRMANAIRRYANRRGSGLYCDSRFLPVWLYAISRCKIARSTYGPEGYGDEHLVKNFDECSPSRLRYGYDGFYAKSWSRAPVTVKVTESLSSMYASIQGSNQDPERTLVNGRLIKCLSLTSVFRRNGALSESSYLDASLSEISLVGSDSRGVSTPKTRSDSFEFVRGRLRSPVLRNMPVSDWHELGPWQ